PRQRVIDRALHDFARIVLSVRKEMVELRGDVVDELAPGEMLDLHYAARSLSQPALRSSSGMSSNNDLRRNPNSTRSRSIDATGAEPPPDPVMRIAQPLSRAIAPISSRLATFVPLARL